MANIEGKSTWLSTTTNIVVIVVGIAILLDSHGPVRTHVTSWLQAHRDRRTAANTWLSVTERFVLPGSGLGAPIVAVEFTDYQCRFCRQMEIVKQETGEPDARVATRHLPLDRIHPNATLAARISICVEELVPSAWPVAHRMLFDISDSLNDMNWLKSLRDAGIPDITTIQECVPSDVPSKRLAEDRYYAQVYGITGTPSYVFPASVHRGATDANTWAELLRAAKMRLAPAGGSEASEAPEHQVGNSE